MKENTLVQYGVEIDPQLMVTPKDITELERVTLVMKGGRIIRNDLLSLSGTTASR